MADFAVMQAKIDAIKADQALTQSSVADVSNDVDTLLALTAPGGLPAAQADAIDVGLTEIQAAGAALRDLAAAAAAKYPPV